MISRSIYNLNIETVYTYDTPIDSVFHQLSNGIRHVMPSTDRRLELKAKDIDGSDRLTAGCVLMDLASPAVSRTAVYAKGLICHFSMWNFSPDRQGPPGEFHF